MKRKSLQIHFFKCSQTQICAVVVIFHTLCEQNSMGNSETHCIILYIFSFVYLIDFITFPLKLVFTVKYSLVENFMQFFYFSQIPYCSNFFVYKCSIFSMYIFCTDDGIIFPKSFCSIFKK